MRLWHEKLIPHLDRQRLLGQHRECAALRGKRWGKKHATVDYAFTHDPDRLVAYHYRVMDEMQARGYKPDPIWRNPNWRGATIGEAEDWVQQEAVNALLAAAGIAPVKASHGAAMKLLSAEADLSGMTIYLRIF